MKSNPIAVISGTVESGIEWTIEYIEKNGLKIDKIVKTNREIFDSKGQRYIVVTQDTHIYGYDFLNVLVTPTYEDLVRRARRRVK